MLGLSVEDELSGSRFVRFMLLDEWWWTAWGLLDVTKKGSIHFVGGNRTNILNNFQISLLKAVPKIRHTIRLLTIGYNKVTIRHGFSRTVPEMRFMSRTDFFTDFIPLFILSILFRLAYNFLCNGDFFLDLVVEFPDKEKAAMLCI
jgi:hypothetical protein